MGFLIHLTPSRLQAMVRGGQRRILKRGIPVDEYIRQAVQAGTYRTNEEIQDVKKQRFDNPDDLRNIMRRFRQDIVRGSNIQDYPDEYLILTQHPPIPDPPRTPKKLLQKLLRPQESDVSKLTKKYMQKFTRDYNSWDQDTSQNHPTTAEEFYRRLYGAQSAQARRYTINQTSTPLSQKPAVIQKAYAAAVYHYERQRTIPGLSDTEVMQQVEDMLKSAQAKERTTGQERAEKIKTMRETYDGWSVQSMREEDTTASSSSKPTSKQVEEPSSEFDDNFLNATPDDSTFSFPKKESPPDENDDSLQDTPYLHEQLKSIFDADAAALEGMMRWSERLQFVPYVEWTVGATTALDHWIARRLLQYSEETWASLLEGNDPNLIDLGKNIIVVRESLFPETIPASDQNRDLQAERTRAIDDELSELFDAVAKSGRHKPQDPFDMKVPEATDETVEQLVFELNRYRERHHNEEPYESWNSADQLQFEQWMRRYVAILSKGKPGPSVDYEETREALLTTPPVGPDEASAFWDQLQNQGLAEALLDMMLEHGPPPGATILQEEFWKLPRDDQIQRLLNLGALRPLLDEYTKESERTAFIQKHANTLLTGVPLDYLVSDPQGPIVAADMSDEMRSSLQVKEGDRFRIETRPFRSSDMHSDAWKRSRELFNAWADFKAGRARYEERLFQTGRLGLRYSDDMEEKYDIEVELGLKEPERKI